LNKTKDRIFGLDLMRAVAIVMVVLSHILWIYPAGNGSLQQIFRFFGFWGVEIFFVLSGFLIGKILFRLYTKENYSYKSVLFFLKRRWFRTLPNYFLILIINIAIAYFIGYSIDDPSFYFVFLQNFSSKMNPFFPESWSLSVEEFAYLFLPLTLLLISFLFKPKNKSIFFLSVVSFLIAIFVVSKIFYHINHATRSLIEWNSTIKSVVIYRIDSILIGVFFSWISLEYSNIWRKNRFNMAFLGTFIFFILVFGLNYFQIFIENYSFFWNVFYLPIVSIAFSLFLPLLSQYNSAPKWCLKPITFLSIISYAIYLLHYSVILQLMKYFIDTTRLSLIQLHLFTFFFLIITVCLSWILYRFFEKPMMDLRDKN
jgi:peptidoglycan/LPS O-acetylase OafA/YrhL